MNANPTVLLTNSDPALEAAIHATFPGLAVGDARALRHRMVPNGSTWCFIDWLLEDGSGLELCRRLRNAADSAHWHITMVLDEDDAEIRRRSLRAGADDYMQGPLSPEGLVARLNIHLADRRTTPSGHRRLVHGDLSADPMARQARWRGRVVALRPNEFDLLIHFLAHPDRVFSRQSLIGHLGKDCASLDERTVDVWVGRLRRALRREGVGDPIRTVRSLGYILDTSEEPAWRKAG